MNKCIIQIFFEWYFGLLVHVLKHRHCKSIIQVDGTHLYGKYKGTLLIAMAQDGNQNILPVAFAVVESESSDAWSFFLNNLRLHVVKNDGVGIISDRHESITSAISHSNGQWMGVHIHCI